MKYKPIILLFGMIIPLVLSSCNNNLNDNTEVESSDIPITINANIAQAKETRIENNHFSNGDAIGFFLFLENQHDLKTAYISNAEFVRNDNGVFSAKNDVYYPKSKDKFEGIGYYPYNKSIINNSSNTLTMEIKSNQDELPNYLLSDFLLSKRNDIVASKQKINLKFNHQCSKLVISITPTPPFTAQDVFLTDPIITLHNMPTTAELDPFTEQLSNYNNVNDIIAYTKWKIAEEKILGCEVLVLPHEEPINSNSFISLQAETMVYSAQFPSDFILRPGTVNRLNINYTPTLGIVISEIDTDINGWEKGIDGETETSKLDKLINISELKFYNSYVYELTNNKKEKRGEICKELLINDELNTQAIVLYLESENITHKRKGIVLATFNNTSIVYDGGTILWDKDISQFIYTPNPGDKYSYFYITDKGDITFTKNSSNEEIKITPFYYNDSNSTITSTYPIVKLGRNFWMQNNLNTETFANGDQLAVEQDKFFKTAGYVIYYKDFNNKLYNIAALLSDKLLHKGWKIPSAEDFKDLLNYAGRKAVDYKSQSWANKENCNRTGFSCTLSGAFKDKYFKNNSMFLSYPTNSEKSNTVVIILGNNKEDVDLKETPDDVLGSIRAIRIFD